MWRRFLHQPAGGRQNSPPATGRATRGRSLRGPLPERVPRVLHDRARRRRPGPTEGAGAGPVVPVLHERCTAWRVPMDDESRLDIDG